MNDQTRQEHIDFFSKNYSVPPFVFRDLFAEYGWDSSGQPKNPYWKNWDRESNDARKRQLTALGFFFIEIEGTQGNALSVIENAIAGRPIEFGPWWVESLREFVLDDPVRDGTVSETVLMVFRPLNDAVMMRLLM